MRGTEVHRRALNGKNLSSRHIAEVSLGEVVGIHVEHLVVAGVLQVAAQVVVVVVGLVDDGRLVSLSLPRDVQRVVVCNLVGGDGSNGAGESVLAVLGHDGKL